MKVLYYELGQSGRQDIGSIRSYVNHTYYTFISSWKLLGRFSPGFSGCGPRVSRVSVPKHPMGRQQTGILEFCFLSFLLLLMKTSQLASLSLCFLATTEASETWAGFRVTAHSVVGKGARQFRFHTLFTESSYFRITNPGVNLCFVEIESWVKGRKCSISEGLALKAWGSVFRSQHLWKVRLQQHWVGRDRRIPGPGFPASEAHWWVGFSESHCFRN